MKLVCTLTQAEIAEIIAKKYFVLKNDVTITVSSDYTIEAHIDLPVELLSKLQSIDVPDEVDTESERHLVMCDANKSVKDWFTDHDPHILLPDESATFVDEKSPNDQVAQSSSTVVEAEQNCSEISYSEYLQDYGLKVNPAEVDLVVQAMSDSLESDSETKPAEVESKSNPEQPVVDHYSLAAQEARYLTITDDIIKEHLVNGGTIASLCDKFDLIETKYSGRLFKRGSRLRSEDASIPRYGRRAEENSTETSYTA